MTAAIYWERGLPMPNPTECELVELDAQMIPALLSAIAGRIGPSHWESEAAYHEGYTRLSRQGAALLMGCKEDIIVEIRGVRDATPTHAPYDLATHPAGLYPGASLAHLVNQQDYAGQSTAQILDAIRTLLQQQAASEEESVEMLGQIILLLGA